MHKTVAGRVEAKKLLARRRQSEYSVQLAIDLGLVHVWFKDFFFKNHYLFKSKIKQNYIKSI